jgi:hypothetical protein
MFDASQSTVIRAALSAFINAELAKNEGIRERYEKLGRARRGNRRQDPPYHAKRMIRIIRSFTRCGISRWSVATYGHRSGPAVRHALPNSLPKPQRWVQLPASAGSKALRSLARPRGVEPLTPRSVVWCSIQLSYGRVLKCE